MDQTPTATRLRLKEIMRERKMTQKTLAELTGLSHTSIVKLVNNPMQIRIDTIETLCRALGITVAELFDYSPQ